MIYGPLNYQVHVNGWHHKRHVDQLQPRHMEIVKDTADTVPRLPKQQSDHEQENSQYHQPYLDGILYGRTEDLQTDWGIGIKNLKGRKLSFNEHN